jgi:hypothetical protein
MIKLSQNHALPALLKVARLSCRTLYFQAKVQQAGARYTSLKFRIDIIFQHHEGRYSHRRITAELGQAGKAVSHKTAARLMQSRRLGSFMRPQRYRSSRPTRYPLCPTCCNGSSRLVSLTKRARQTSRSLMREATASPFVRAVTCTTGKRLSIRCNRGHTSPLVSNILKKTLAKLSTRDAPLLHSAQVSTIRIRLT